ncbi:MAG: flagellar brake protein [Pseudohaliea sp.]
MADDKITDRNRIAALLDALRRQEAPVQLLPAAGDGQELSLLLACSRRRKQLVLDAPRGLQAGDDPAGRAITVLARLNGAELRFDTTILAAEEFRGYAALRAAWPHAVLYRQRRRAFRAPVGGDRSGRLELYDAAGRVVRGRLTDLSAGGFGALVDRAASLREREEVESTLAIDGLALKTTIRIMAVRIPARGRFMRIGAAFRGLSPGQEAQVEKLVRALERHAIRRGGARR